MGHDDILRETANFASVYSSAWKHGWGNTDIFYVYPNQVSKTPKSGEFLKKESSLIAALGLYPSNSP